MRSKIENGTYIFTFRSLALRKLAQWLPQSALTLASEFVELFTSAVSASHGGIRTGNTVARVLVFIESIDLLLLVGECGRRLISTAILAGEAEECKRRRDEVGRVNLRKGHNDLLQSSRIC